MQQNNSAHSTKSRSIRELLDKIDKQSAEQLEQEFQDTLDRTSILKQRQLLENTLRRRQKRSRIYKKIMTCTLKARL